MRQKFAFRPHVCQSPNRATIPYRWRSHGCIGISTNDEGEADEWIASARDAGYTVIFDASHMRDLCAVQAARALARRKAKLARRCAQAEAAASPYGIAPPEFRAMTQPERAEHIRRYQGEASAHVRAKQEHAEQRLQDNPPINDAETKAMLAELDELINGPTYDPITGEKTNA